MLFVPYKVYTSYLPNITVSVTCHYLAESMDDAGSWHYVGVDNVGPVTDAVQATDVLLQHSLTNVCKLPATQRQHM